MAEFVAVCAMRCASTGVGVGSSGYLAVGGRTHRGFTRHRYIGAVLRRSLLSLQRQ